MPNSAITNSSADGRLCPNRTSTPWRFNARASTLGSFTTPFAEEDVKSWELGLKSEWMDNRLRLNAAVFTNDYTDIQIAQFEAGSGGASSPESRRT